MKGVVLSGGTGTRLRPLTHSMPKQLIPVGGRPVLHRVVSDLADAGIRDVIVIVGSENGHQVRASLSDGSPSGVSIQYVDQPAADGLAAAYELALPLVDGQDTVLYLGDCLITGGIRGLVEDFYANSNHAQILVNPVTDPHRYGIVEIDERGMAERMVEKPPLSRSDLAIVGVYAFGSTIGEAVRRTPASDRGEREITDAIQRVIASGGRVGTTRLRGWWRDTGTVGDVLAVNRRLLSEETDHLVLGKIRRSRMDPPVAVYQDAVVEESLIQGPCIIGRGSRVSHSRIGAGTAIGPECDVRGADIEDSILIAGNRVVGWRLRDSLLGERARLEGNPSADHVSVVVGADALFQSPVRSQSGL